MGVAEGLMLDIDFRAVGLLLSFSSLSEPCVSFFSLPAPAALAKSKADPGVFGVLPTLPKLANAPLPKPKADDAPAPVGEATEEVVMGLMALKGLLLLFMLPKRFAEGVVCGSRSSLRSDLFVETLSLLVLLVV